MQNSLSGQRPWRDVKAWTFFGFLTVLFFAVYAAYANIYPFAFLYDDEFLLVKNRFLSDFDTLPMIFRSCSTAGAGFVDSFYRPMQITAYLFVTQLFGHDTAVYHGLNVTLHAANAGLVFWLGQRLGLKTWAAFCATLVWAVHPLHTEAVTYMSATADPLHVFFILLSVLAFLNAQARVLKTTRARTSWLAISLAADIAALLSKEAAIVLPALLVAVLFLTSDERRSWRTYRLTVFHWIVAGAYLVFRKTIMNFDGDFAFYKTHNVYTDSIVNRLYTFFATLPNYAELLLWPHRLHIDHDFSIYTSLDTPVVMTGALLFAGAIAMIVYGLYRKSASPSVVWAGFAALWFFGAHVPESGVLIPLNSFFLEHWMYLPTIGLAWGAGYALGAMVEHARARRVVIAISCVFALLLGIQTFVQNTVWESPVQLFTTILKYNPRNERVRHNLAMAYSDLGENTKALEQYDMILKGGGHHPQTFHNIGFLLLNMGQTNEAEQYLKRALEENVNFTPSYVALIQLYERQGRTTEAHDYREKLDRAIASVSQSSTH